MVEAKDSLKGIFSSVKPLVMMHHLNGHCFSLAVFLTLLLVSVWQPSTEGVRVIHEWAWAGTPNEGAVWLRLQRLTGTWLRILLIPVTTGVVVGLMQGLLQILDQIKLTSTSSRQGPESPSAYIGKSFANGCSKLIENNRERGIAFVAAGAAAGIASGFNVLNVLLGERPTFIVPTYELKSTAELPLYLILGMLCGVVSVAFTRLVTWFTKSFEFIKKRYRFPEVVCPALGGMGVGMIALRYSGILYWGFTYVDEILHTVKSASASKHQF